MVKQKDLSGKTVEVKEEFETKEYRILKASAFRIRMSVERVDVVKEMKEEKQKIKAIVKAMKPLKDAVPNGKDFDMDLKSFRKFFGIGK